MLNVLQCGRFVAAMVVVIHHAALSTNAFVDRIPAGAMTVLDHGYLGVDFFFVLSGFIIHFTMQQNPKPAGRFAYDRITRIMLPYWPVGIALALALTFLPGLSQGGRSWGWLSTLTLFPTEYKTSLNPAWSLQHEMVFYLLYAVLFYIRQIKVGLAAWALAICAFMLLGAPTSPVMKLVFAPINLEFISGIIAAHVFMRDDRVSCPLSISAAVALLVAFGLTGERSDSWLFGLAIACLVPMLCNMERDGLIKIAPSLVWGGGASYSIYLVHDPVISACSRLLQATQLNWPIALIISTAMGAGVGALYFLVWERPVMGLAKRFRLSARQPQAAG